MSMSVSVHMYYEERKKNARLEPSCCSPAFTAAAA